MSTNRTFNATVVPRTMSEGSVDGSGNIALSWSSIPGHTYQIVYKVSFEDPAWLQFGTNILANGNSISVPVPTSPETHRFYQIFEVQ